MSSRVFGSGIRRREDPRLITGSAAYTDDLTLPGMVHAAVLRSPHAHARIKKVDTSKAKAAKGVLAVFTGADTEGALKPMPCAWLIPNSALKTVPYPALAKDVVRYVGNAVAIVVAEDRYQAQDALDLIEVQYEPLPVVIDPQQATKPGAPQLHEDAPGNQAFHWVVSGGDVDTAFNRAEVVVKERIVHQRLIPNAIEPRSVVVHYVGATGELTLWTTTQAPHIARFLCSVVSGVSEDKLRVVAPEVGGAFGSKIAFYPDYATAVFCAMKLGRPVKWTEDRAENFYATTQERGQLHDAEIAVDADGRILGVRDKFLYDTGAYDPYGLTIPINSQCTLLGCYDVPNYESEFRAVFTTRPIVTPVRGAGRQQSTAHGGSRVLWDQSRPPWRWGHPIRTESLLFRTAGTAGIRPLQRQHSGQPRLPRDRTALDLAIRD